MIEIWTEDSTVGYRFLKLINKYYLNNQYKIVPHIGNGNDQPNKSNQYGGILYHLKNKQEYKNLTLLMIDKTIDNPDVLIEYKEIIQFQSRHRDRVKIIDIHSFEYCLLSYKNMISITGNANQQVYNIIDEFLLLCEGKKNIRNSNNELKNFLNRIDKKKWHTEYIAKLLLSDVTNVATTINRKDYYLSLINKGKMGVCWVKDCCILNQQNLCRRKCKLNINVREQDKIKDIILNSAFISVVSQIEQFTIEYINQNYISNSTKDNYYKQLYESKYNVCIANISKCIERYNYWNYERLVRLDTN